MTKKSKPTAEKPRCGLCGKTKKLTKTECCGHWICDDEDQYALFSYERNSCHRNHRRYTLCGYHYDEGHGRRNFVTHEVPQRIRAENGRVVWNE